MTPELAYFLKINVGIALFYAFYRLCFYKDTFFFWRRTALLCFFAVSLLYPLMNIQEWIKANEPMVAMVDLYTTIVLPEQVPDTSQETVIDWTEQITQTAGVIYWIVVALLLSRFLIQLGSIIRLRLQCAKSKLYGVHVHLLKEKTGPFSFFHWIFIHPDAHTESEISEIITHEETHARQYHSVDVVISELMSIFCWFNPFIWLMKREVRGNLEYMADHRVLKTGHDCKSYQYHLLGLAHHKAAAKLSNSFNVLPLKNRIKMMNKRRTKEIGRTKYLMFLPLAALLMIISNIEMVARTTKEIAKEVIEQATKQTVTQPEGITTSQQTAEAVEIPALQDKKTAGKETQQVTIPQTKEGDQDEVIFEQVEKMPNFPGGMQALMDYLSRNVKYPVEAQTKGIQGRIIVQFIVRKDGSITDIKTIRGVDQHLDKEAERVVAAMPTWEPGTQRGKAVNVRFTVPIMFRLSNPEPVKAEEIKHMDEVVVVGYGNDVQPDTEEPLKVADKMPGFPGGQAALFQYLARSIKYPVIAQTNKEQGKVVLQMVIGKNGAISNIKVLTSVSPSLDAEAVRVISNMPKWKPGMHQGKAVPVQYTIPVTFRLQ